MVSNAGTTTSAVVVHGAGVPVAKSGLPSSWAAVQLPAAGLIVQLNEALPDGPLASFAVTVTLEVAAVVGVPVINPVELLIARPAGSPVALYVSAPLSESLAWI